MFSEAALKLYALIAEGKIKSNADFWKNFSCPLVFDTIACDTSKYEEYLNDKNISLVCTFDENFPAISIKLTNSEKPFLFAYQGDISLLSSPNNFAIVGTIEIDENIEKREKCIIRTFVLNKYNIVSGLALGCDTVAHIECIANGGKTIAILPSTIENIIPYQNKQLASNIVKNGGLVLTEYILPPKDRYEQIRRFVDRDRLQAMFSSNIVLIASYRKGEGDSGARHAMKKAKQYGHKRIVMFDKRDANNPKFGLNKDMLSENVEIFTNEMLC